jgi:membrane-bound serine protease (ClpP class)
LRKWAAIILGVLLIFLFIGNNEVKALDNGVYVIPIEGEVGPAMDEFIREGIKKAEKNGATAIIFDINTPGGRVDSAVSISEAILNTNIKTIAFVNGEAISAGTIITISAEKIVMSPASTIGAAETRPNEEKYISYWTGKLRNVAQLRGRDPVLVASMADADIEIEGVVKTGKLLTLTTEEAQKLKFTDAKEKDIQGILKTFGLEGEEVNQLSPSFQLRLASLATSVTATSLLLTIGFIGIVIEIITPGFGLGGIIALTAFGLYFGGVLLAGYSTWIVLVIFIVGLIFLLVEAFAPGFGVPGILGIIAIITSIVMSSSSIEQALLSLLFSFILTIIAIIVLIKFVPKRKFLDKILLSTSLDSASGYLSNKSYKEYEGRTGVTITPLRPSGTVLVDDKRLDVVSENAYINKDEKIRIVKVEGRRIIVRKID